MNAEPSAVQLCDFLAQRQSQAGATLLGADLNERLEDAGLLAVGDALAGIFDADDQPIAMATRLQADLPAVGCVP